MKKIAIVTAIALSLGVTSLAFARDQMKEAVKAREAAFELIAANFGPMGAMVKGEMPFDKAVFARRAANVEVLSTMPWEFFIPGSDKGDTEAKKTVWSKPDEFKAASEKFQETVAKLASAAKSGDEGAMKAAFGETAKTCKGCHKEFKED